MSANVNSRIEREKGRLQNLKRIQSENDKPSILLYVRIASFLLLLIPFSTNKQNIIRNKYKNMNLMKSNNQWRVQ